MFGSPETTPGRSRAQVLLVGPPRRPQDREPQGRHGGRRLPHAGQGRQEQGRPAVPSVRVRHHVRQGHLQGRLAASTSASTWRSSRSRGAWFTYEGEQLGQGRENAASLPGRAHRDARRDRAQDPRRRGPAVISTSEGDETHRDRAGPRRGRDAARPSEGQGEGRAPDGRWQALVRPLARRRGAPKHPKSCHERALGLLAVRPRSRRELERRLLAAGFESEEVGDVLERLERVGLVDDDAFARAGRRAAVRASAGRARAVVSSLMGKGVVARADRCRGRRARPTTRTSGLSNSRGRDPRACRASSPPKAFTRLVGLPDTARLRARDRPRGGAGSP